MNNNKTLLYILVWGVLINTCASIYVAYSVNAHLNATPSVDKKSKPVAGVYEGEVRNQSEDTLALYAAIRDLSEKVESLVQLTEERASEAALARQGTENSDQDAKQSEQDAQRELADTQGKDYARSIVSSGYIAKEDVMELQKRMSRMSAQGRKAAMSELVTAINEQRVEVEPGAMF